MGIIKVESFNPFEARYPGHKVVPLDTLILIKKLRQQNIQVIVLPEDGRPVEYLYRKGLQELFTDPIIVAKIIDMSIAVALGILANAISKMLEKPKRNNPAQITNIKNVIINNGGQVIYLDGSLAKTGDVAQIIENSKKPERDYANSLSVVSPYPDLPKPIYLEHTGKIVGWGDARIDVKGIKVKSKITDDLTLRMIISGQLKGYSISGISLKSICSICKKDYITCNHIAGEIYNGLNCTNKLAEVLVADISVVSEPANKECYFETLKPTRKTKIGKSEGKK